MIIGLATFANVTFAGYVEYPPREYWFQYCLNESGWIIIINANAGITRCEDAN